MNRSLCVFAFWVLAFLLSTVKVKEDQWRDSEAQFRALFDNMAAGGCVDEIVYKNGRAIDYRLIDVNKSWEAMMGFSRSAACGSLASELYRLDQAPFLDIFAKVAETGEPASFETFFAPVQRHLHITVSCPAKGKFATVVVDISERKRAEAELQQALAEARQARAALLSILEDQRTTEQALKDSHARLQSILNGMFPFVGLLSLDGIVLEANRPPLEAAGLRREDVIGKACSDTYWFSYSPTVQAELRAALARAARGETVRYDVPIRVANEQFITIDLMFGPLRDTEGKIAQIVGSAVDITARKQAETDLRRFRLIADSSHDFIGMCDLQLQPIYVNPAGQRLVGLDSLEAACRVKVPDYFFPEDRAFITEKFFPRVLRDGHGEIEIRLRHFKTGATIWMLYYLFHVRDATGAVIGWATVSRNIDDRRRAEQALRDSEERLRLALDAAHMGTFDWDVPHNRITWSRWHEELWGYAPSEFAGTFEAFAERVHPEDVPGINAEVARCMAAREPFEREFRVVWSDGSVHWVQGRGEFTFDAVGKAIRMRGVVMEITERKLAETALQQSHQRLQELSRKIMEVQETERRHLARELHDELGQLLTVISVNLKAVRSKLDGEAQPQLDESIGYVDRVIQEVRNLSLDLRPAMLDDLGLASAVRWYAERQAERAGFQVELVSESTAGDVPTDVKNACFRVAQEALTNVVRYGKARRVRVELHQREDEVELIVQDDGIGFDATAVRRRAAQGKSVGVLGMQERTELLSGAFEIQSAPGQGCTIRARFPLPTEPEDGERPA